MSSTSHHNPNRDNCRPNLKWKIRIIKQNTHKQARVLKIMKAVVLLCISELHELQSELT